MWCKVCGRVTYNNYCELCGAKTEEETPSEVRWCPDCNAPVLKTLDDDRRDICPVCGGEIDYLVADLRPVFPQEKFLIEALLGKRSAFKDKSVWACNNRYYIDGKAKAIPLKTFRAADASSVIEEINGRVRSDLESYQEAFERQIQAFLAANQERLRAIVHEAFQFIQSAAERYETEQLMISFSGGKDSTVTQDLVARALSNPSLVHVFGNTTLEFPMTLDYVSRFRKRNPKAIFKVAQNKEQDFYSVCRDIGPPARMMRWCCSMFKTGPITRVINSLYRDERILTFYGIRAHESVSRSKYQRLTENSEAMKIQKQSVASPVFFWKDIDIWLYILNERLDFNDAYRLGYDRVGCWCCPNNHVRAQFLSRIYMPERSEEWRNFLIGFARQIGKPDPETYVDDGKWKARQGGNGVAAAEDIKIKSANCTSEEYAKIYQLNKAPDDSFLNLFVPFGKLSKELGRKLLDETIVLDDRSNVPILSIQPFQRSEYEHAAKIKVLNVSNYETVQRMVSYQVRKFNACRKCLKCESVCKFGAISMANGVYKINESRCRHCKACMSAKYLDGGCLMDRYLKTVKTPREE